VARNASANAAGVSGGTGFAGLVLLMPVSFLRDVLLILAPAITIIITSCWDILAQETSQQVADWRLRRQRKRAEAVLQRFIDNPDTPQAIKDQAKAHLQSIAAVEMEIASRGVRTLIGS